MWAWARRLARPVVALAALWCLIQFVRPAWDTLEVGWAQTSAPSSASLRHYDDIERQFATAVPPGSSILVDMPFGGIWPTRIIEYATRTGVSITADRAEADYLVSVAYDPALPYDFAAALVVTPAG